MLPPDPQDIDALISRLQNLRAQGNGAYTAAKYSDAVALYAAALTDAKCSAEQGLSAPDELVKALLHNRSVALIAQVRTSHALCATDGGS